MKLEAKSVLEIDWIKQEAKYECMENQRFKYIRKYYHKKLFGSQLQGMVCRHRFDCMCHLMMLFSSFDIFLFQFSAQHWFKGDVHDASSASKSFYEDRCTSYEICDSKFWSKLKTTYGRFNALSSYWKKIINENYVFSTSCFDDW